LKTILTAACLCSTYARAGGLSMDFLRVGANRT
jgi:hypothetical protein